MSLTRIDIRTRHTYPVFVGSGALGQLDQLEPARCALLADRSVFELHGERLGSLAEGARLLIDGGEPTKSLTHLGQVLDFMAESNLDRGATLLILGGGTLGDLGGLAASLFLRGIDYVSCPTTLLAQVDASVGGKTAINLTAGKNLAGTFHQPRLVLADTSTLATLPLAELRSGLGEVLKTALVGAPPLLELLETCDPGQLATDPETLAECVRACVTVKGEIVAEDEREAGRRAVLNLGHTFAHTIERAAGFGRIPHGEAVATGLALAVEASLRIGLCPDGGLADRLERLLERLDLAPTLGALRERFGTALPTEELLAGLRFDKKNVAGETRFVLLAGAGDPRPGEALRADLLRLLLG